MYRIYLELKRILQGGLIGREWNELFELRGDDFHLYMEHCTDCDAYHDKRKWPHK